MLAPLRGDAAKPFFSGSACLPLKGEKLQCGVT